MKLIVWEYKHPASQNFYTLEAAEVEMPAVIHKQELSAVAPEGVPSANPAGNQTLTRPLPLVNPLRGQVSAHLFFDPKFWGTRSFPVRDPETGDLTL